MPEPQLHPEHTPPTLDKIFVRKMHHLLDSVVRPPEKHQERFFTPRYQVIKEGRQVDCYAVRIAIPERDESTMHIVAAAQHLPVAHSILRLRQKDGQLMAENDIMTGMRGAGFALPPYWLVLI